MSVKRALKNLINIKHINKKQKKLKSSNLYKKKSFRKVEPWIYKYKKGLS